jgi:hypothetical protein
MHIFTARCLYKSFGVKGLNQNFLLESLWCMKYENHVQCMVMHVRVRIGKFWLHIAGGWKDEFCKKNV